MRWKVHRGGHDPRQIDLLAMVAIVIIIVAACRYFDRPAPPVSSALVEPSQSVRW